jgi:hypothetical protein
MRIETSADVHDDIRNIPLEADEKSFLCGGL